MAEIRQQAAFQSTLPARGATKSTAVGFRSQQHFNPRSPHGERQPGLSISPVIFYFNPRSPHGERHFRPSMRSRAFWYFNPRSPHGERHVQNALTRECGSFQPTLPARGATLQAHQGLQHQGISTHAPRTGSDTPRSGSAIERAIFQPTLPARGATAKHLQSYSGGIISTHAPRTGSDRTVTNLETRHRYFNPRSPHGERQRMNTATAFEQMAFQPTLPARGATALGINMSVANLFQPTLPARGATRIMDRYSPASTFQPTLPARGATIPCACLRCKRHPISTHAPRTGSDIALSTASRVRLIFQPTLPARGATATPTK